MAPRLASSNTFCGFRSRWMMGGERPCRYCIADATCRVWVRVRVRVRVRVSVRVRVRARVRVRVRVRIRTMVRGPTYINSSLIV